MRHLIAQGLKQRSLIRTRTGFVPIVRGAPMVRGVGTFGGSVGHRRITEVERTERDSSLSGEGLRKHHAKKSIKPLKFRI